MPAEDAPPAGSRGTVAVVFHEEVLGGATLSVVRLISLLERRGWKFRFWASRPSPLFEELRGLGLDVDGARRPIAYSWRALGLPPGRLWRMRATPGYLRRFRDWLRRESTTLVHANSVFTLAEAYVAARTGGCPVVFHLHEMLPAGRKGRLARRLAARLPGEIVGVSRACAGEWNANGRPVRVVYESAPVPQPAPERSGRTGPMVVGTVGVISTRKGSDVFVEAAEAVIRRDPEIEFEMIGAPTDALEVDWAHAVLERARGAGIRHQPRADVPARLAEWDAFVLPSRRDPFPISMLEAMGSALPVVGTAVDGIPEQITPEAGVVVPPEDPSALADAILELHSGPQARIEMGRAGRRRILERFTLEHQAAGIHAAYIDALGHARD